MKTNKRTALILKSKEVRYQHETHLAQNHYCYLTVSLNIPSQHHITTVAVDFFNNFALAKLENYLQTAAITYQVITVKIDYAGTYGLIALLDQVELNDLKLQLLQLEASHPAFQVIDYDLYNSEQTKLSRQDFAVPLRQCYLCHQPALACHRLQNHSVRAVLRKIYQLIATAK